MTELKNRIDNRLNELDRNQTWLARKLGMNRQNISGWLIRGQIPSRYIPKIADLLECTADSLLIDQGIPISRTSQLSAQEQKLLEKFRLLSKDEQLREITYLRGLVDR